jgi:hypothetical protein
LENIRVKQVLPINRAEGANNVHTNKNGKIKERKKYLLKCSGKTSQI